MKTHDGITGLGELGPRVSRDRLEGLCKGVVGEDVFQLNRIHRRIRSAKFYRMELAIVGAAVEMACLDIIGQAIGQPIGSLLGGRLRDSVPTIGYLYRRAGVAGGASVLTNTELVSAAEDMYNQYGFTTWKLKAGGAQIEEDVECVVALRARFPEHKLRLDPNGSWSLATAIRTARQLQGVDLEWVEDPVLGVEAMGSFRARTSIATATNMCCVTLSDLPATVRAGAIDVMLLDLWYLGGIWSARVMATMCEIFGISVGIHSGGGSPETGIGLAAELHLASALPSLVHAIDSSYFELSAEVITNGPIECCDGRMRVPDGPGLGVELDEDAVQRYTVAAGEARREEAACGLFPAYPLC
ncbi:MAG: enolase C-terminal domain-like protein [Acidimicrobiales bacterium]